jgi:peptidoglycan/xylan/chitin deacetylase (PgdA/CDA1 family)
VFAFHGVEPQLFEEQMKYLAANGYKTVSARQLLDFMAGDLLLPRRSLLLTFDDGYESVWTQGAPILKKYGFQATAFIIPSFLGRPKYLTWEQVKLMHQSGLFDIQSHTLTHRPMTSLETWNIENELRESKRLIEAFLPGHRVDHLCYPYGLGSPEAVEISRKVGYLTNFWSALPGGFLNTPKKNPYYVVRVKHDYIFRLPGKGRKSFFFIFRMKVFRRLKGKAYA